MYRAVVLVALLLLVACGGDSAPPPGARDGGDDGPCAAHRDCDDGVFCNGVEACDPSAPAANARGCRPSAPPCPADECIEARAVCETTCADADGDGHLDATCGGDDCDDSDPDRFPGAVEVCDLVDDDCDPATVGDVDLDEDGYVDAACCNGEVCGDDCDDLVPNVHRTAPEVCDEVDQDCDGRIDEGVNVTVWPDVDNDGFGDASATGMVLCERPSGTADRGGDCDDTRDDVSPLGREICNGVDDDCDTRIDEGMDEACQAGMPTGTIGACFRAADGTPPTCTVIACAPTYFDCDGFPGTGCEQNLCTSRMSCDRCARSCSLGCDGGGCAGLEVPALHRVTIADAAGTVAPGVTVSAVDTCRPVSAVTDADGLATFGALPVRHVRASSDGAIPSVLPLRSEEAAGRLYDAATLDGWYAAAGLSRDPDKGTVIVSLDGFFRANTPVLFGAVSGGSFYVEGATVTPSTSTGPSGTLVFANVSPGMVSLEPDAGAGCNFLCSGGPVAMTILVVPGEVTSVVYLGCGIACA